MAAIADAARQVYFAYRDYFWATISEDEDRHYPHQHRGEIAARTAPIMGADNQRMAIMAKLLAILNTELNAALLELRQVHHQQVQDWDALDNLQAILLEHDQVPRTVWLSYTPPRHEDPPYGSIQGHTRIG